MNSINPPSISLTERFRSVDVLRGAVMVLMAIDHVRVYSGVPAGGSDPGVFFTRWITHFCAPAFVFLAGTSAFLYGRKINDRKKLSQYLISRGLLLVLLELTLIRYCWTFNFDYGNFILAGVIWMLGWCMVLMAALVWFRPRTVGIIGISIIFLQQLFGMLPRVLPASAHDSVGKVWEFIYPSGLNGPSSIAILYVLVPWIGIMAAGYGFGSILLLPSQRVRKVCLWIGLSAIALFLAVGTIVIITSGSSPENPPFIFRLLNQNKYPASQLYLLMTLGPLISLVPFTEKAKGWLSNALGVFGKTPFFFYLMHIPLIHISALIVSLIMYGEMHHEWYASAPFASVPEENRWGLPLLYLVFIIDIAILYFLCKWYSRYKAAHPEKKWLKYL